MKRILLLLPLLLVTGCGYGSKLEADEACDKWRAEGKDLTWKIQEKEFTYRQEKVEPPKPKICLTDPFSYPLTCLTNYGPRTVNVKTGSYIKTSEDSRDSRNCWPEEETRQVLGKTWVIVDQKEVYDKDKDERPDFESSITKRFKY